ncbi:MAG: DNA mismatch repair ATPase msh1, partial [Tremellales sp. Tagirdzhanova-0007]
EYERNTEADMVPRRVGRVVTPGTLVDESWLIGDESRYLLALAVGDTVSAPRDGSQDNSPLSLVYTDVSTGELFSKETTLAQMEDELARIAPREVVLDTSLKELWLAEVDGLSLQEKGTVGDLLALLRVLGIHVSFASPNDPPMLEKSKSLTAEGASYPKSLEAIAISLLRHHLQYALRESTPDLPSEPNRHLSSAHMQIDAATLHALEIRHAIRPGGLLTNGEMKNGSPLSTRGTLLSVLNRTITPPGHRLLIRTLSMPSTSLDVINSRLALVQAFVDREELRGELRAMIKNLGDIVRMVQRFRGRGGEGRSLWETGRWIRSVSRILNRIREELAQEREESLDPASAAEGTRRFEELLNSFRPLDGLLERLESSIDEEAVLRGVDSGEDSEDLENNNDAGEALVDDQSSRGKITERTGTQREQKEISREEKEELAFWIRPNFSLELTRLYDERRLLKLRKDAMQTELRRNYDVDSLLLTKSFRHGYYILVPKRAQSTKLVKSKQFQAILENRAQSTFTYNRWTALGARREGLAEELSAAQYKAFKELRDSVLKESDAIQHNAGLVDEMDLCMGFAQTAVELDYVRPVLTSGTDLTIVNGRHPSVESGLLSSARTFTPTSTTMKPASHLHVITGPNQGGKSTLLRQTAIIAILAQAGSFVPADFAELGIVDKVFSRVGARDDLFRDRSTFMLEMVETASILRHATNRSLVIMDEIGRGTTLQAGVSIAFATLDYILRQIKCRTLFATHYHELAEMLRDDDKGVDPKDGVEFWCTNVDELDGGFSYSYRLRPGINRDSHAIRAAQLAGMPQSFLKTAQDTLTTLQNEGKQPVH